MFCFSCFCHKTQLNKQGQRNPSKYNVSHRFRAPLPSATAVPAATAVPMQPVQPVAMSVPMAAGGGTMSAAAAVAAVKSEQELQPMPPAYGATVAAVPTYGYGMGQQQQMAATTTTTTTTVQQAQAVQAVQAVPVAYALGAVPMGQPVQAVAVPYDQEIVIDQQGAGPSGLKKA